ncbi:hypothetical protein TKK_0011384 [Trichogramma kaykai]|uniref:Uncharacterized protein n=1 Tax=Trichogramma kaykai TaxID=54128 RepID=A0ABD2WSG5_9HYME
MYKLDVSTWCYLKRRVKNEKLKGFGLTLDNRDIDKFSDIVISHNNNDFIHVSVNYTVSPFAEKFITYLDLFVKKSPYSLNNYFNSYVDYVLNKPNHLTIKLKYLAVFCNDKLQLSEDDKLIMCSSKYSYPFQFESFEISQIPILGNILVTNESCKFFKFATDNVTIEEFSKRLKLSCSNQKIFRNKQLTVEFEEDLKKKFLTKIIFIDNQPCRESLKKFLKQAIHKYGKDYIKLQNKLINYTSIAKKNPYHENFKLLMSVLSDMFIEQKISAKTILYEFAPEASNELIASNEEEDVKLLFLHTLVIATGPKLGPEITIENAHEQELYCSFDQLQEVNLQWLEFQKHQIMTLRMMRLILGDINNGEPTSKYLKYSDVSDE